MKKLNNLIALILLFTAISACKSRKVAIDTTINNTKSKEETYAKSSVSEIDKSKTTEIQSTTFDDSTETTTIITPAPGKPVIVGSDGSFKGEATTIKSTTKKKSKAKTESKKEVQNNLQKDSSGTFDNKNSSETHQKKKLKQTESKPNYSWIFYVFIIFVLIGSGLYIYRRFKK